jgi:hypothetical protein
VSWGLYVVISPDSGGPLYNWSFGFHSPRAPVGTIGLADPGTFKVSHVRCDIAGLLRTLGRIIF